MDIPTILKSNDLKALKELFAFDSTNTNAQIAWKFNVWCRKYHAQYFTANDADFHKEIDEYNIQAYRGQLVAFVDVAFRGAAKTARTKLFLAFCITNDMEHYRRFYKILAEDGDNSKQIVTDIYNILVMPDIAKLYPETFEKTIFKREEKMETFTTATKIKVYSDTVGTDQRGAIQEESRPDFIWFEDFENRTTLRSARKTKAIWENMEEARTGLAKNGACLYTCNYISEQGNVHTLIIRTGPKKKVLIVPIENKVGIPTWPEQYDADTIAQMKVDDEDFEGERMCKPSASKDVLFDREMLEKQEKRTPIKTVAGFKIFYEYNPSHRYGAGHDVAGGVGLDSSTSCFIDFSTVPARVVGTFANNMIRPDTFGDEIARESDMFGGAICAPERNNHGHATIARAKQLEVNMYSTKPKDTKVANQQVTESVKEYGWHTNALTKPKMLFAGSKAIEDGLVELNDPDLIAEAMAYTRNDLIDDEKDPRLTTRHFDLLIAFCIAWQMKDYAEEAPEPEKDLPDEREGLIYPEIGM